MENKRTAGRPAIPESLKAKRRNLAFTDAEWNHLTELGRAKWVRIKMQQERTKDKK